MSILITIATVALIIVSVLLVLIVLAQKSTSDGGMGAAMGGGMAEAAFGAETGNVLSKTTINLSIAFFVLSFGIYLGQVYQHKHMARIQGGLPNISGPALPSFPPATVPNAAPVAPANK